MALSRAEITLVMLQQSERPDTTRFIHILDLATPAPRGFKWVQVRAEYEGKSAQLTGLVPLKTGGQP